MKSETLKNALNAHGWIGLIISLPLFIVFWAGAVTFFMPEMEKWSAMPRYSIDIDAKHSDKYLNYNELIENHMVRSENLIDERVTLRVPTDTQAYLELFYNAPVDQSDEEVEENNNEVNTKRTKLKRLTIDPYSGKLISDENKFELADFLYRLHYTLKIPQGKYIVGLITFFFFVIIITGVVIQFKNLIKNFFLYRKKQKMQSKMHDLHNVIGVISLPYAAMYALTGVMLNLLIVVQIPTVLLLYNGDLNAVVEDAGVYTHQGQASGQATTMPNLRTFIDDIEHERNINIYALIIYNYGDSNAVIQVNGVHNDSFHKIFTRTYELASDSFPNHMNPPEDNVFSVGLRLLYSMHYADFAGIDMRILYFVLAMLFCGMIVAGNVLWVVKRQAKNQYPKVIAFTRASTLGACIGVITATACAILLERMLPAHFNDRVEVIEYAFGIILFLVTFAGFFANKIRPFIAYNLIASGSLLLITVAYEWVALGSVMVSLGNAGYKSIWYFSFGLFVCALLFLFIGRKVMRSPKAT